MRRLRRSKGDRALLEGPHLVGEALDAGVALELVLATPEMLAGDEGRRLAARLAAPPLEVAGEVLATLADADSPRGMAAIARLPRSGAASLPVGADGVGGVYLYLDGLQDPGNLGALARVAEAAGAAGLALGPGTVHPNHPRALRGSAGSLLRLPAAVGVTPDDLDRRLREGGAEPHWIALATRGGASLWSDDWAGSPAVGGAGGPLVLAVGAEGPGLSPDPAARAAAAVTIPLAPPVESLNAVVAAALVLFELRRRAAAGAHGQPGSSSDSSR